LKTIVLGIGNRILRDDGIGPAVIRELESFSRSPGVFLGDTNLCGMPLLDLITGYDTLIIIDAIQGGAATGTIQWMPAEHFKSPSGTPSQHEMNIFRVLELGRQLGIKVPSEVKIMAIEAHDVTSFGEYLTPEVAAVIPRAAAAIIKEITILEGTRQSAALQSPFSASMAE
jgi:hydrogenase maturation protease